VSADFLRETGVIDDDKLSDVSGDLLLISEAKDRCVNGANDAALLRHYWRLLFRAVVSRWLASDCPSNREAERRFQTVDSDLLEEARFVLTSDSVVRRDASSAEFFPAFTAALAELSEFDSHRLRDVFPSAPESLGTLATLGGRIDFPALARQLRPEGASDQAFPPTRPVRIPARDDSLPDEEVGESDRIARLGNYTRAAIRRCRAARAAVGAEKRRLESQARSAIRNGLVKGVARVLHLDADLADRWSAALWPLVEAATEGLWPHAARALYDLQRVAADLRGRQFAVTPVQWLASLGRHPVQRPLDRARDVILHTRLLRIERHVLHAGLAEADRDRILGLLHAELNETEGRVRAELGPIIRAGFDRAGLVPADLPERVARDKLVAELLDHICDHGYLRLGDLRDAVARNQLKLADLGGPGEFLHGDALLRADKLLANELFGVYHRGEAYLRGIQRGSSLFFGTSIGRAITLYLALPLGGAFLTLMFAEELRHIGGKAVEFASKIMAPRPAAVGAGAPEVVVDDSEETFDFDGREAIEIATGAASSSGTTVEHHGSWLIAWPTVVGLALFFLLILHVPRFRRAVIETGRLAWFMVRLTLWEFPVAILQSPAVRALWQNRAFRFVMRYLASAIIVTAIVVVVMSFLGATPARMARWAGITFTLTAVASNTRLGRRVADQFADHVSDSWRTLCTNLIPGLVGWFVWAFKELLGAIDRALYAVDERLRYREGALKENWRLYSANRSATLKPVPIGHHGETGRGLLRPGFHSGTIPKLFAKLRAGWLNGTSPPADRMAQVRHDLHDIERALRDQCERELFPLWSSARPTAGLRPSVASIHLGCRQFSIAIGLADREVKPIVVSCRYTGTPLTGRADRGGWDELLDRESQGAVRVGLKGFLMLLGNEVDLQPWPEWVSYWSKRETGG
jgi:hypothetical protein